MSKARMFAGPLWVALSLAGLSIAACAGNSSGNSDPQVAADPLDPAPQTQDGLRLTLDYAGPESLALGEDPEFSWTVANESERARAMLSYVDDDKAAFGDGVTARHFAQYQSTTGEWVEVPICLRPPVYLDDHGLETADVVVVPIDPGKSAVHPRNPRPLCFETLKTLDAARVRVWGRYLVTRERFAHYASPWIPEAERLVLVSEPVEFVVEGGTVRLAPS